MLTPGTIFAGAGLAGLVAACWGRVKAVFHRLVGLMIVRLELQGFMAMAVSRLCWERFRTSPFGDRQFTAWNMYVRPMERLQLVGWESVARKQPRVFWKGWRPLMLGMQAQTGKGDAPSAPGAGDSSGRVLTFVRGMFDVNELLFDALGRLNDLRISGQRTTRFRIQRFMGQGSIMLRRQNRDDAAEAPSAKAGGMDIDDCYDSKPMGWTFEQLGWQDSRPTTLGPFDVLAFPSAVMLAVQESHGWLDSKDWYRRRGIPWRRGWLMTGAPGTGKTSLVRAIAEDLDLPVFVFDLATMNNEELVRFWSNMRAATPCIALLEDIDATFQGRGNVLGDHGGGLTFDCLLNVMGGIETCEGVFTIVTTNRPEHLDPALGVASKKGNGTESTRPGRLDRVIHLADMDADCRRTVAARILSDCAEAERQEVVAQGDGETGAAFTERCARVALAAYWDRRRGPATMR